MSSQQEKLTCVVCHAYLFPEDDVVYCPICGAPHHRDCYEAIGRCGLEEFHGTDKEYKKPIAEQPKQENDTANQGTATKKCAFCKHDMDINAKVCPNCGRPNVPGQTFVFDFSGGVADDEDLGGAKAKELSPLVAVNTQRYLPKFLKFKNGKKISWNWLAFFFPEGWFFSRKMYKLGFFMTSLLLAFQICLFPILEVLNGQVTDGYSYGELVAVLTKHLEQSMAAGNYWPFISITLGVFGTIIIRIISGIFGDKMYHKYVLSRAKEKSKSSLTAPEFYHKYGGVNIFAFLLGVFAMQNLPSWIFDIMQKF